MLASGGNVAVTHLAGRAFPGLHIQGDTFANLRQEVADVARRLRQDPTDGEALDDLDHTVREMTELRTRAGSAVSLDSGACLQSGASVMSFWAATR